MKKTILLFASIFYIGMAYSQQPNNKWAFEYATDPFSANSLIDLRYLNENEAGESGFIKLSPDSASFINSSGKPIRFWAVNGGENTASWPDADLARFARFIAKLGINVIRYHGSLHPVSASQPFNSANPNEINSIQRLVAAMKKEGVYTIISPYYSHKVSEVFSSWNIAGYTGKSPKLDGVIFFHDGLKNAYKQWITELFNAPNPYGVPLKDEPAVAVIQTHNEDGLFFYTVQAFKPEINTIIRKKFYDWLVKKYGSISAAQTVWGNVTIAGDNPAAGEMDVYIIWEATQATSGAKHKRLTDQMEFFAEVQTSFYSEMYETFRKAGCKQLINGSNWKSADAVRLLDVERATAGGADVIALNRYYSPTHTGYKSTPDNSAWRIDPGHYYEGKSVLLSPESLPINIKQPVKRPVMVTESGWNLPHKYQAEGPFLVAAYSSLIGIDAFFWFSSSAPAYDDNPYFYWTNLEGGQHPLHRWTMSTPGQMAMFPANALTHRLGYVTESKTLVSESRTKQSILNREIPMISEDMGFDPNRDEYIPEVGQTELSGLSYLTGKIEVSYNAENNSKQIDPQLNNLINYQQKTVTSATGQLKWNYKKGVCTLDAPSAQGICGFVGQTGIFELTDIKINTQNEYAAINVVAMDERPIANSGKILIQVGTTYRPTGWSETPASFTYKSKDYQGFLINNTGQMPWQCEGTKASVAIKNKQVTSVKLLDVAGYPRKDIAFKLEGDWVTIELPADAMYVVLQGQATSSEIIKKKEDTVKVYPNPAGTVLKIETGQAYKKLSASILTIEGESVKTIKILNNSDQIELFGLTKGMYFLELFQDKVSIGVYKFIKK